MENTSQEVVSDSMELSLLPGLLAVVRLEPEAQVPGWASAGGFHSVTRTKSELSVVCQQELVPANVDAQDGFRCLMVEGPLAFTEVGILASLSATLANAQIPIFVLSTFDTDYILVASGDLSAAISALTAAGHEITAAK